jgi:hypothetical protein
MLSTSLSLVSPSALTPNQASQLYIYTLGRKHCTGGQLLSVNSEAWLQLVGNVVGQLEKKVFDEWEEF